MIAPRPEHRAALIRIANGRSDVSLKTARELETMGVIMIACFDRTYRIKGGPVSERRTLRLPVFAPTALGLRTVRAMRAETTARDQDQTPANYMPLRRSKGPSEHSIGRKASPRYSIP